MGTKRPDVEKEELPDDAEVSDDEMGQISGGVGRPAGGPVLIIARPPRSSGGPIGIIARPPAGGPIVIIARPPGT